MEKCMFVRISAFDYCINYEFQVQTEVRKFRQREMKRIEEKVSIEINHSINMIINYIKLILKSKQEKVLWIG